MAATLPRPASSASGYLTSLLDYGETRHRYAIILLTVLALLAFLPGFSQVPPVDREEPRFAQAAKQMIETGNYVDIRFQETERYAKPIGIYWLQAAVVKAAEAAGLPRARIRIWLYRLPSLFAAIGVVLMTYWSALAFVGRRPAVLAGAIMACCVMLGIEARLAKTDAVLLLTTTIALGALGRIYLTQRESPGAATKISLALLFWTAIAVGTLVKGPIIWLFAGLPAVVLSIADRNARWLLALRPLVGLAWCALIALPWFIAIVSQSGVRFLSESIVGDLLSRTVTGKDGNWRPPGFHFLLFWIMFWPGAPLAAVAAPQLWQMRGAADVRFLLAWIIPSWIVFEIALTKQPHYVLPLFPAIAIAIAVAIERRTLSPSRWLQNATVGWFLLPLGVFITSVIFIAYAGRSVGYLSWPIAAFATTIGAFAWWLYTNREIEQVLLKALAAALLVSIAFHGLVLPALAYVSPSPEIARYLRVAPCAQPRLASAGYQEPSLVFLAGTQTVLTDGRGAAEFLREGGCRYVAVESRQLRNFTQYAENAGIRYESVGRVERFNLARVRRATILVFRAPMGDRAP